MYFCRMNKTTRIPFHEDSIADAAIQFLGLIKGFNIITFSGDLGAGKTTFIQAVCAQLQTQETATSPTYSIIQEYTTKAGDTIYHMDWYRLKDVEEALDAGVEECLLSGNVCFIEWPDRAAELLPEQTIFCNFIVTGPADRILEVNRPE